MSDVFVSGMYDRNDFEQAPYPGDATISSGLAGVPCTAIVRGVRTLCTGREGEIILCFGAAEDAVGDIPSMKAEPTILDFSSDE